MAKVVELVKDFGFESAHSLPNVPEDHKCRRIHGHSYRVELTVRGPIGEESGWLIDYADIKEAWTPLHKQLDHRYLNEIAGLENPTSENLAVWIWERLEGTLPWLHRVVIHETTTSRCIYFGPEAE